MHDETILEISNDELVVLEAEASVLLQALEASEANKDDWEKRVSRIEDELDTFETMTHFMEFTRRAQDIQLELEQEADVVRAKLEGLVGRIELKYADEEKERAYMATFNKDVSVIYESINCNMDDMRTELKALQDALKRTGRSKTKVAVPSSSRSAIDTNASTSTSVAAAATVATATTAKQATSVAGATSSVVEGGSATSVVEGSITTVASSGKSEQPK